MTPEEKEAFFRSIDAHYTPEPLDVMKIKALIDRELGDEYRNTPPNQYDFLLWVSVKAFTFGINTGIHFERSRRRAGGRNDY